MTSYSLAATELAMLSDVPPGSPTRELGAPRVIASISKSRYYLDVLTFEWDERKNRRNRAKHGIWFEEAKTAFEDPRALLADDPDHSADETRFLLLGMSTAGRVLVVVHCYREESGSIRLISARKATKKEEKAYAEGI